MIIKVVDVNGVKNFNNSIKDGSWLVWYYADWCGHCKAMENEWENLESKCDNDKRLNIAKVNDQYISQLNKNPNVQGFPTIKLYKKGNEVKDYSGERDSNSFLNFLKANVSSDTKSSSSKRPNRRKRKSSRKKRSVSNRRVVSNRRNNSGYNTNTNNGNNTNNILSKSRSQSKGDGRRRSRSRKGARVSGCSRM